MRYYIYISTTKLNMLVSQISSTKGEKASFSVKLNAKVVGAEYKKEMTERSGPENDIQMVDSYLKKNEFVGDVRGVAEYVYDIVPLAVILLSSTEGVPTRVLFGGRLGTTWYGFIGSAKHLVGEAPREAQQLQIAGSFPIFPGQESPPPDLAILMSADESGRTNLGAATGRTSAHSPYRALQRVLDAAEKSSYPSLRVEVLARRFGTQTIGTDQVVFGSPIYVALA